MNLADLIKRLRAQRAMSLQEVAVASGCFTRQHIHDIEHGRAINPTVATILALGRVLRTKPEIIFAAAIESHKEPTNGNAS